jgi:putative effector of murein hydrolase LrgA (UPF0299 family)
MFIISFHNVGTILRKQNVKIFILFNLSTFLKAVLCYWYTNRHLQKKTKKKHKNDNDNDEWLEEKSEDTIIRGK